jgi:diguanylate cyclase (GGDEF)-like protein
MPVRCVIDMRDSIAHDKPLPTERVLFVDDDDLMRQAFAGALRQFNYEVDTAASATEAIARLQGRAYPVVVTDLHLPGIDGIALIEQLSSLRPDTAFVLVTADPHPNIARNERVDPVIASVLEKPIDVEDLARTMQHAFDFQKQRSSVAHPTHEPTTTSQRVLVVEENAADSGLIIEMLHGHEVRVATRLSDALALIRDESFATIITDVALPDARGIDAVTRLRAAAPQAAIIAVSSMDNDALAQQFIQLGAQDYLLKQTLARRSLLRAICYARERKHAEQRLLQLAHYDQLTGLANRLGFLEHMTRIASRARRLAKRLGVLVLDLDGFKNVNDTLGHDGGDALLEEVSHRLRLVFREYDVVARIGGDEFAVLLCEVENVEQICAAAERVLNTVGAPAWIGDNCFELTASIGIAVFPDSAESITDLLRCADAAMYEAKRAGKNAFRVRLGGAVPPRLSVAPGPISELRGVAGGSACDTARAIHK